MSTFGTVLIKEGNFFVDVAGKQQLIPVSPENAPHLKELVGKKVEVVFSEPQTFIAGLILAEDKPPIFKRPRILCYVPRPDFLTAVVEENARIDIAKQLLEAKVLSKEAFEKIAAPEAIAQKKVAV